MDWDSVREQLDNIARDLRQAQDDVDAAIREQHAIQQDIAGMEHVARLLGVKNMWADPIGAPEHCRVCGGFIGPVSARYARHNDECRCMRCVRCQEIIRHGDYRIQDPETGEPYDIECWDRQFGPETTGHLT